jgi:hypothetical protein
MCLIVSKRRKIPNHKVKKLGSRGRKVTSITVTAEGKAVTETPRMAGLSAFGLGSVISRSETKKGTWKCVCVSCLKTAALY